MSSFPYRPHSTLEYVFRLWVWALVLLCSTASQVFAAAPVIVIVRAVDATDPAPYELRLRSELAAEGIDAIVANPNASAGADYRALAARFGTNAIIDVSVSANELSTVIWALEPSSALEVTRQLKMSNLQRDAVGVFALRAVDFLQGARLDLEQQRRAKLAAMGNNGNAAPNEAANATPPSTTPPQTKEDAELPSAVRPNPAKALAVRAPAQTAPTPANAGLVKVAPKTDRFRLDLSYALLIPGSKFGWATAPALSISWLPSSKWACSATASGPYVNHIETSSGRYRSTTDQEFFQIEVRRRVPLHARVDVEPYLALGGSRFAADGRDSAAPLVGHLATAWSLYGALGGALVWHWGSHFHLVADLSGLGRWQAPKIMAQLGNDQAFTDLTGSSRWNLLLKLGPGWSF